VGAGQPRKFTGKERDQETGLDYFGARFYAARVGRFTTVDPLLDQGAALINPQKWNRYGYGLNNPFRYVDPDGRDAIWVKHANGTATLVIPVQFSGADATESNVQAIVSRTNGLTVLDPNVSIHVISTDTPIKGKLNRLDFSAGSDTRICGGVGECVNRMGGNKGHINSANHDAIDAAAHDILHFAGVPDAYKEGPPDDRGRRTSEPLPGFTNSNIMASRKGTELTAQQAEEARRNRTTKTCSGEGTACR
jgi:RHS repeat-associated protein